MHGLDNRGKKSKKIRLESEDENNIRDSMFVILWVVWNTALHLGSFFLLDFACYFSILKQEAKFKGQLSR